MSAAHIAEQRQSPRRRLTGLLPGKLLVTGSELKVSCRPVDISTHGLGILSEDILEIGAELLLITHNQQISLQVAWSKLDFGKRDRYRYGLVAIEANLDLEALFVATGCLK